MSKPIVLLADDHPILRKGLAQHIADSNLGAQVLEATDGLEALKCILENKPDVAILDIDMPHLNGLEVARKVAEQQLQTRIILLTLHKESGFYQEAINIGVMGYVLKEAALDQIIDCIRAVSNGSRWFPENLLDSLVHDQVTEDLAKLTNTERKVLQMIAREKTSREIADLLFISEKTVETHRTNISRKLDLGGRNNSLLTWAVKHQEQITSR